MIFTQLFIPIHYIPFKNFLEPENITKLITSFTILYNNQWESFIINTFEQKNKVDDLTTKIAETRTGVTDVKQFIDGMRTSRDTKMAELNALKTQLKEQNQRLLQVTQERAKIESKNKVSQKQMEGNLGKFSVLN